MTHIRLVEPKDRDALKAFFLSLSDETVFRASYFDSRAGKTNSETGAQAAADLLTSPMIVRDDIKTWLAEELEIQGLGWLEFTPWRFTERFTAYLGVLVGDRHRHRGIGTELMLTMVREAKAMGMRKIWLRTYAFNQPAISLFKQFGFEQEGYFHDQEWTEDGQPVGVVSMGKFL